MSKESEIFLRNMFNYFKENNSTGRYLYYEPEIEFSEILTSLTDFLNEMNYVTYDSKKATIMMITKSGQVYALKDILSFNNNYSEDLCIIGVGIEPPHLVEDGDSWVVEITTDSKDYQAIPLAPRVHHRKCCIIFPVNNLYIYYFFMLLLFHLTNYWLVFLILRIVCFLLR